MSVLVHVFTSFVMIHVLTDKQLLEDILSSLRSQVQDSRKKNLISIHRPNFWLGVKMGIGRKKFDELAHLDVNFVLQQLGEEAGEGAVDLGGP